MGRQEEERGWNIIGQGERAGVEGRKFGGRGVCWQRNLRLSWVKAGVDRLWGVELPIEGGQVRLSRFEGFRESSERGRGERSERGK